MTAQDRRATAERLMTTLEDRRATAGIRGLAIECIEAAFREREVAALESAYRAAELISDDEWRKAGGSEGADLQAYERGGTTADRILNKIHALIDERKK